MSKHGKPNENTPAKWSRNVVLPAGGDSILASLAAPVVEQTLEGTKGVKIDGEKKNQKCIEEAEVTDMPVASKNTRLKKLKKMVMPLLLFQQL